VVAIATLMMATSAWAHHPTITAEAWCDDETGEKYIDYTSTSWRTVPGTDSGANSHIDILMSGVVVASGAYTEANGYSFSGTLPAPSNAQSGDTVVMMALAVGDWGSGYHGGQSESTTVTIPEDCIDLEGTGRFTGGGRQIRGDGMRITRGLTIHCDLLLSNNLQVNWPGNRFHMTEHMTTVSCTDDPLIMQEPPDAPLDTLVGVGTGRWNNEYGYTIEFTLIDAGEPGRDDKMAILIYETANPSNIILDVPLQYLYNGNLQAHYDQPHKN
jgi:hypothetical protein